MSVQLPYIALEIVVVIAWYTQQITRCYRFPGYQSRLQAPMLLYMHSGPRLAKLLDTWLRCSHGKVRDIHVAD